MAAERDRLRQRSCAGRLPEQGRPGDFTVDHSQSGELARSIAEAHEAEAFGLAHADDNAPGIRRRRAGKGCWFSHPDGTRVTDPPTLSRIASLAIPPAWTDVWISPDPDGHIQATGRDAKGRKQYRYHPQGMACRDEAKFSSLAEFAQALPAIRSRVDADLRRPGVPRERVLASIVWLLDNTLIRIGNEAYTRANKSYGLTTLRSRHVEIEGQAIRFAFIGKSGQEWRLKLQDRRIARIVRAISELPGQHLFQYMDNGTRHPVQSSEVNAYLRDVSGAAFTSKHFRTWGATRLASEIFAGIEPPPSQKARAREANRVFDAIAARLRNTRAVCRSCYVHPGIVRDWEEGRLNGAMAELRRRFRRPPRGLEREEHILLQWLVEWNAAHSG
jgi:DNA topoisomerase-1